MAVQSIGIADKATLDYVKGKCDDIYEAVQSGGGGGGASISLNNVNVFVPDIFADTITVLKGALDTVKKRITV